MTAKNNRRKRVVNNLLHCTCGGTPEITSKSYGWGSDEQTSYTYECKTCGKRLGRGSSKIEAMEAWNKNIEYLKEKV